MTCETFRITRMDGRSNQQVILDAVKGGEPGRVYTYQELADVLSKGTGRSYTIQDVQGIVRQAGPRLSKEQARALQNVATVGYRLAHAGEHCKLALIHTRKSEVQLHRGFELLSNVRMDEMDANQRQAHEGHLLITAALYQNQRMMWKKQQLVETALESLKARVDAIAPVCVV